ncbi:hypothetical protein [Amycolatopsis xylanica]|uniref:hypothetical protein n=1 Tax=Amycolatopsis xylanica TaxID=589385 RepID=UPI0011600655|nr:hypothetical protein [Amycolatopsis xylanica]
MTRHRDLLVQARGALRHGNALWAASGYGPMAEGARDAYTQMRAFQDATIFGMTGEPEYAVLYLRWEVTFPEEWRAPNANMWSPWARKEGALRRLGREGVPARVKDSAVELLDAVLRRPYRRKDWNYAEVARRVDYADRLDVLYREQPLRAEFIQYVIANPQVHITRKTWTRWLERTGHSAANADHSR